MGIKNYLWFAENSEKKIYLDITLTQSYHYENTPIQIYRKLYLEKVKIFR